MSFDCSKRGVLLSCTGPKRSVLPFEILRLGTCHRSRKTNTCLLRQDLIEKRIHDLISASDDPVCQFFDLDTTSDCASKNASMCVSENCSWDADYSEASNSILFIA